MYSKSVGVIVGRFQVPELHVGHLRLVNYVNDRHSKLVIVLGVPSKYGCTKKYPLSFELRRQMILNHFPSAVVLSVKDVPSDEDWSESLDVCIGDNVDPNYRVKLYGARDSFIKCYSGKYETEELLSGDEVISGTAVREECGLKEINSSEFRSGVIWAMQNLGLVLDYPTEITDDVAEFMRDMHEGKESLKM